MKSSEAKRYLQQLGATFAPGKGGHLKVTLNGRHSVLPMKQGIEEGYVARDSETARVEGEEVMRGYPAKFQRAKEGGFTVTFRDVPEAITEGDTLEEAQVAAADALETDLRFYLDSRKTLPKSSALKRG